MDEINIVKVLSAKTVDPMTYNRAYNWMFDTFFSPTIQWARKRNVPVVDAQNILKETIGDIILALRSGKGPHIMNFRKYLFGALKNNIHKYLRGKGRHYHLDIEDLSFEDEMKLTESPIDDGPDDDQKRILDGLDYCIRQLPPSERTLLRLHYLEERKYQEIEKSHSVKATSAVVLVFRGMAKLKKCMSKIKN